MTSDNKRISKKIVATCFLAGMLEIYDFTIFGFLSSYFNKNYFVFLSSHYSLIATYALFAVGFLFRPIGSIIFGFIGDKYGRKKALVTSVSLMGLASLGMGLLPSYGQIGIISCLILVLLRVIQGVSVGGEYTGALIYAIESNSKNKAGFVGSIIICGCMSGILLANLISYILKLPFVPEQGWRFAFFLGFVLTILGYFIRARLVETEEFILLGNLKDTQKNKASFFSGIKNYKLECLTTIFVSATNGVNLYFTTIYLPNYLKTIGIDLGNSLIFITAIMVMLIPIFGFLSDKLGRGYVAAIGMGLQTIYSLIMLPLIIKFGSGEFAFMMLILFAVFMSFQSGASNVFAIEIFPSICRFSCSAVSWSIGMGIIGGSMPLVASFINEYVSANPLYISLYITIISFFGLIAVVLMLNRIKSAKKITMPITTIKAATIG